MFLTAAVKTVLVLKKSIRKTACRHLRRHHRRLRNLRQALSAITHFPKKSPPPPVPPEDLRNIPAQNADSYIGDKTPAAHDYGKYYCLNCGKVDPQADKYWALISWVDTYGELTDDGRFSDFPYQFAEYSVSVLKNPDDKFFYIYYYDLENDIYCRFSISEDDTCNVHYSNGKTNGNFDIGKSALYKGMEVTFDYFYTSETENKDENVIAEECSKCIDDLMLHIENDILYPKLGLKMSGFGFINYK